MTRISSLFLATSLAILPISAFAQSNVEPMHPDTTAPTMQSPAAAATMTKTPSSGAKTTGAAVKKTKITHAKASTKTAVPMKSADPSKS